MERGGARFGALPPRRRAISVTGTEPLSEQKVLINGKSMQLLMDCSLSLINRTGAHYISEDLAKAFGGKALFSASKAS